MTIAGSILALLGALLVVLAGVGVLRFPDVLTRANASTKAAGLGVACVLAGAALLIGTTEAAVKLGLAVVLQFATAPVAGHVMGRAAYRAGTPLTPATHIDDLARPDEPADHGDPAAEH